MRVLYGEVSSRCNHHKIPRRCVQPFFGEVAGKKSAGSRLPLPRAYFNEHGSFAIIPGRTHVQRFGVECLRDNLGDHLTLSRACEEVPGCLEQASDRLDRPYVVAGSSSG